MNSEISPSHRQTFRMRFANSMAIAALLVIASSQSAVAGDWQTLFDGKSLDGWKVSGKETQFQLVNGVIFASSSSKTHFLCTENEYRDFELELEVKLHDKDLNSGVQIRTKTVRTDDKGNTRPSVHGPQADLGKSP